MKKTFHIIILGLFIAQSLVLYVVEGMLPVPFIAPGAKLGLANLITVIALYALPRKRDVCLILLVRIILATAFGGGINAFLYSVAGAAFSLGAMMVLQKTGKFSIIGVSTAGGIFHNLGQVIVASLVVENINDHALPADPGRRRHGNGHPHRHYGYLHLAPLEAAAHLPAHARGKSGD